MPLYTHICTNGHREDFWARIEGRDEPRQCACGAVATRVLAAPRLRLEIPSYQSPIDGRWIDSRAARREDLARNGCMEWDPELRKDIARRRKEKEDAVDRALDNAIEDTARAMIASGDIPPL